MSNRGSYQGEGLRKKARGRGGKAGVEKIGGGKGDLGKREAK